MTQPFMGDSQPDLPPKSQATATASQTDLATNLATNLAILKARRRSIYGAMWTVLGATIAAYAGIYQSQANAINPCQEPGAVYSGPCFPPQTPFNPVPLLTFIVCEMICLNLLGRLMRIRHELGHTRPAEATGTVIWQSSRRGGRYVPIVPNMRLRVLAASVAMPLFSGSLQCPPGTYRFSYLPHTRVLTGTEWLGGAETAVHGTEDALRSAFDFTDEDVAANRAGMVSPRQRRQLRIAARQAATPAIVGVLIFVGWLALSEAIFSDLFVNLLTEDMSERILVGVFVFIGAVCAFTFSTVLTFRLGTLRDCFRYLRDLRVASVSARQGEARKGMRHFTLSAGNATATFYRYSTVIGGTQLMLRGRTKYNACLNGMQCRVFYVSNSRTPLSFDSVAFPGLHASGVPLGDT